MKQKVNYIEHHKKSNLKLIELSLNSTHISLYNALFLIWNECGFDTELSINRNDVMKLSKIGSANTYTKCLKDLHENGLINYKPSHNPLVGSKINLYRFDNSSDNSSVKSSSKGSDNSSDNSSDTLYKLLNKETIKLINSNYEIINKNLKEWIDNYDIKPDIKKFDFLNALLDLGVEEQVAKDWLTVRKKKKASNTKTAFTKIKNQINKTGLTANEVVEICASKDWKGFESKWLDNALNKIDKNETINELSRRIIEEQETKRSLNSRIN